MEAAREAYDAFLSHYPYCYGYWRKYADYEKRKGNKKRCEEVCTIKDTSNIFEYIGFSYTYLIILQSPQLLAETSSRSRDSHDHYYYYIYCYVILYLSMYYKLLVRLSEIRT